MQKFSLEIKDGIKTIASFDGRSTIDLKISELEKTIEVEQFLERLFGYRFHINHTTHIPTPATR